MVVRPFRAHELDRVLKGRTQLRERIRRSGTFHGGRVDLAIEVEGKLVGEVQTYVR